MTEFERSCDAQTTETARDWIVRLASGDMTEEELAALGRWREVPGHEDVFQHELQLWRSFGAAAGRLAPHTGDVPARSHRRKGAFAAIAACIALLAAAPELLVRLKADHRTGVGIETVALPDGSRVLLDAESAMAVDYTSQERRVTMLRGRAWFDVVHDGGRPFRVSAQGGWVEDIGTAFQVSAEGDRAEAAVTEGVVRVKGSGKQASWLRLRAGQRASWTAHGTASRESDLPVGRIAAWREGDVLLDAKPVRQAVAEIGRYRNGPTFVLGDVDRLPRVTAIIRADRADEGLDAVAASAGLRIVRLPGGIAIVSPGA
ncbi:FecR family protein [Sphingobium sp. YR657]|uniref:FecR family protein n=1 Tax=Sphingobium sp. YR657 TaxID=1884366 RepID=UPI0009111734|nr:FecR domain-containing protein [Sphingobium sp. YR657]SHL52784.1 FecR family protein [Sphingobium sp. YR657]